MDHRIPQDHHPPLSYFISIRIPQAKIKIKVPKLLAKTMQKRFVNDGCNNIDEDDKQCKNKKRARNKPRKLLARRVGSIFTNAFGNKKALVDKSDRDEQESSGHSSWVPSKFVLRNCRKLRMAGSGSPRKIISREFDEDSKQGQEETDGEELCKKRILMGGKCKPLNLSGTLRYDQNGILLTEILP